MYLGLHRKCSQGVFPISGHGFQVSGIESVLSQIVAISHEFIAPVEHVCSERNICDPITDQHTQPVVISTATCIFLFVRERCCVREVVSSILLVSVPGNGFLILFQVEETIHTTILDGPICGICGAKIESFSSWDNEFLHAEIRLSLNIESVIDEKVFLNDLLII